jgi:hypothetical protein
VSRRTFYGLMFGMGILIKVHDGNWVDSRVQADPNYKGKELTNEMENINRHLASGTVRKGL